MVNFEVLVNGMSNMKSFTRETGKAKENVKDMNKGVDEVVKKSKKLTTMNLSSSQQSSILSPQTSSFYGTGSAVASGKGKQLADKKTKALKDVDKQAQATKRSMLGLFGADILYHHFQNFKEFAAKIKTGFGSMATGARVFIASIAPLALTLTGIFLIFKAIKQAFEWNIGGIMQKWTRGMGEFKAAMGELQVATFKLFKAMAPVFRVIGDILLFVLRIVTKLIKAISSLFNLFSSNSKGAQAIKGIYSGGAAGVGTGGSSTNNNITVISNRPIDEKGAKGFEEQLNNRTWG